MAAAAICANRGRTWSCLRSGECFHRPFEVKQSTFERFNTRVFLLQEPMQPLNGSEGNAVLVYRRDGSIIGPKLECRPEVLSHRPEMSNCGALVHETPFLHRQLRYLPQDLVDIDSFEVPFHVARTGAH